MRTSPKGGSDAEERRLLRRLEKPCLYHSRRVGGRLGTVAAAIIAHDLRDPQPVGAEDALPPQSLGGAVRGPIAPGRHRSLVAPEGQRQELARLGEALEPLDR